jgi:DNA-binding LytR/AlgR family response regulator
MDLNNITCMIVDDEPHAVTALTRLVAKTPQLKLVHSTTNPVEALHVMNREDIAIVFLDIRMPDITGLEFIKMAQKKAQYILCTAYRDHALESYEYEVVDYLLKPIEYTRFLQAVQKAVERIRLATASSAPTGHMLLKTEGDLLKIPYSSVLYIESSKNYVIVHSNQNKYITRSSLSAIENDLPEDRFLRIHNSYIVNKAIISGIKGNHLLLQENAIRLNIGITYKQTVLDFFKQNAKG